MLLTGSAGTGWIAAAQDVPGGERLDVYELADPEAADRYGIGPEGAVLVRPDGHVAWRDPRAPGPHSISPTMLLGRILGVDPTTNCRETSLPSVLVLSSADS